MRVSLQRLLFGMLCLLWPTLTAAHPAPFTYLDLRLQSADVDVTLVAHIFDVAHDLQVDDPNQLLDPAFLGTKRDQIFALFNDRLRIGDEAGVSVPWTNIGVLPERQSIALSGRVSRTTSGALPVNAHLFPYDPAHQTFINVYENGELTLQAILDGAKTRLDYFSGSSASGIVAVFRRFAADGARHIAFGAEHWLFLLGLALLGGGRRAIARQLAAFVAADVITTALIAFNLAHPAARLTDPALALSVIYIGADNLMVRGGRDVRPLIALAFGVLHGFWFGGALALMDLPRRALVWSLISFDAGAIAAQATLLIGLSIVVSAMARRPGVQRVIVAGSVAVVAGGVYLFVQRVFFPSGLL